jgi:TM2 domain-containing membrane protein YozV
MASQFGRKPTAVTQGTALSDLESRRAAFIASERARRAAEVEIRPAAAAATHRDIPAGPFFVREEKSLLIAYLLWFFLGGFSAHRFYAGATASAAVQLVLNIGGLFLLVGSAASMDGGSFFLSLAMLAAGSLWVLADMFLIPGLCRRASTGGRPGSAAAHAFG